METESSDGELESTVMQMIPEKFNGTDYINWSRRVETFLKALRLADHLTNDEPGADDHSGGEIWEQKDAQVMCILMNSVESKIRSTILYLSTAKEMWLRLKVIYWGNGDLFHKYAVCKRLFSLKQGTNERLIEFLPRATTLFYEMKLLFSSQKQTNDIVVFRFLDSLRDEFEPTINQILQGTELPTLHQVFDICLHAEDYLLRVRGGSNSHTAQGTRSRGGSGSQQGRLIRNRR